MNGMLLKMGTSALKTKMEERELDIDWDDFNYPPGLRIIHYNPIELVDKDKTRVAHMMHIAFLLVVVFYAFNITINVIAMIGGDKDISFFMPLYSVFHTLMGIPLALGVFSKGYRTLAGITDERTFYKWGEVFILAFTGFAFCFQMLCYHGIKTVLRFKSEVGSLLFILGLIEEGILLVQWCIRLYVVLTVLFKYMPATPEDDK